MNGWTVPTTVFLLAALLLSAGLLAAHYLRVLAAWWRTQGSEDCRCPQCRTARTLGGGR